MPSLLNYGSVALRAEISIEMLILGPARSDIEGDKPCSEGHREPAFLVHDASHDASKGVFLAPDTSLGWGWGLPAFVLMSKSDVSLRKLPPRVLG